MFSVALRAKPWPRRHGNTSFVNRTGDRCKQLSAVKAEALGHA